MFNSAKRVVKTLKEVYLPDFATDPTPSPLLWGPFIALPEWSDGMNEWPPVYGFVLGPLAITRNTIGEVKVGLASGAADHMCLV